MEQKAYRQGLWDMLNFILDSGLIKGDSISSLKDVVVDGKMLRGAMVESGIILQDKSLKEMLLEVADLLESKFELGLRYKKESDKHNYG